MKNNIRRKVFVLGLLLIIPLFMPYLSVTEVMYIPLGTPYSVAPIDILGMANQAGNIMASFGAGGIKEVTDALANLKILMFAPVTAGVAAAVVTILWKRRISHLAAILLEITGLLCYALSAVKIVNISGQAGGLFKAGPGLGLIVGMVLLVVMLGLSCAAFSKERNKSSDRRVTVREGDGILTGVGGSCDGARIPVTESAVVIGRDAALCNLIVTGEKVSREHCSVVYDAEKHIYSVTDLSTNGTYDGDGKRLSRGVAVPMEAGSMIQVGEGGECFKLG